MTVSKKSIILSAIVVLVVLVVLVAVILNRYVPKNNQYSVVYVSTGEVYVGKLSFFPDFELKDSYLLQVTKDANDPTKNSFKLQPINQALWAPQVMHFIKDNVIFYGPLMSNSAIAKKLVEQK